MQQKTTFILCIMQQKTIRVKDLDTTAPLLARETCLPSSRKKDDKEKSFVMRFPPQRRVILRASGRLSFIPAHRATIVPTDSLKLGGANMNPILQTPGPNIDDDDGMFWIYAYGSLLTDNNLRYSVGLAGCILALHQNYSSEWILSVRSGTQKNNRSLLFCSGRYFGATYDRRSNRLLHYCCVSASKNTLTETVSQGTNII